MKIDLHKKAIFLRKEKQLTYTQIRNKLKVSKSTLSAWLRNYPLSEKRMTELEKDRQRKAEVGYERYRNTMLQKKKDKNDVIYQKYKKKFLNITDQALFASGAMLYLAEGQKRRESLKLSNSDPEVIKFFMDWSIKFLKADKNKFRVQLHLYEDMNLEKETKFWQNTLCLRSDQFWKTQVRPVKSTSFTYKDLNRHGTCSIYIGGSVYWREVMMASKALIRSINK